MYNTVTVGYGALPRISEAGLRGAARTMEWGPVTGSWPARGKGPGAAGGRLMRQDRCFRKFSLLFFFFFLVLLLFELFFARLPCESRLGTFLSVCTARQPKTRMGKGLKRCVDCVCMLCMANVGAGGLRPPVRPSRDFCPICLVSGTPPRPLCPAFLYSVPRRAGKVHAVQVIHIDLIPVCHMIFFFLRMYPPSTAWALLVPRHARGGPPRHR